MASPSFARDASRVASPYTVVVGIDFEPGGDDAFREASRIAARNPDAELHVVHCLPARDARHGHFDDLSAQLVRARDHLAMYVSANGTGLEGRMLGMHVRVGATAAAILQLAADLEADLIVVGQRHDGAFRRFLATSTAQRLVRAARCPVLVARAKDFAHVERSPTIEPPCAACVAVRRATNGARFWCERHAEHHVRGHAYSYARRLPLADHDSEVVPTGVSMGR